MLVAHRKDLILTTLRSDGRVVAKQLAEAWGVSEDTIRRDLRELAAEGLLHRVHGGALPASPAMADFAARTAIATDAKAQVAALAAALVQPGQTVAIDGGTTARELARRLPPDLTVTVVTHSPTVAVELAGHPSVEVVIIGGRLFKHSVVAAGAAAHEAIGRVAADVFFLGVTGIHPVAGLTTGDVDEAAIKRAWVGRAAETYVLGSGEKIGAASPFEVVPLAEVTAVLTDALAPPRGVAELRDAGVDVRQPPAAQAAGAGGAGGAGGAA